MIEKNNKLADEQMQNVSGGAMETDSVILTGQDARDFLNSDYYKEKKRQKEQSIAAAAWNGPLPNVK